MQKVLNIDWLQFNCRGIMNLVDGYTFRKESYSTRVFGSITTILKNDKVIFTVAHNPLSYIIEKSTHLVKFDNSILYSPDLNYYIDFITTQLGLKFIGITRLDVCLDFNYFDCNLGGSTFIKNFLSNKYWQKKVNKFKVHGIQGKENEFEYLKLGSNNSPVCCYLYNKTKEMNDVKFKQHIYTTWKNNNIDVEKNVWRLEFSIKNSKFNLVDTDTGEIEILNQAFIKSIANINKLFYYLYSQYFNFYYQDPLKKPKDYKNVGLFTINNNHFTHRYNEKHTDTTKSDKIFLKKLEAYNNEIRQTKKSLIDDVEAIKLYFIESRRLEKFYHEKIETPPTNAGFL